MSEKIQIGGELEPKTTDKILGDASTIIDRTNYADGKRQDIINQELAASIETAGKIDYVETSDTGDYTASQLENCVKYSVQSGKTSLQKANARNNMDISLTLDETTGLYLLKIGDNSVILNVSGGGGGESGSTVQFVQILKETDDNVEAIGTLSIDGVSQSVYAHKPIDYLELVNIGTEDSPSYVIKANYPFYSTGEVAAFGEGSEGSGSSIDVVNNLETKSVSDALSANMGYELNTKVAAKQDKLTTSDTLATINGTALKYGGNITIETGETIEDAVRYDTAQTLTDTQKSQARTNIGAISDGDQVNSIKIGNATLSWDSTAKALKIDMPMYSTGEVSAYGTGEGSSSTVNVVDNLTSTSSTDALSAKQGNVLNTAIAEKQSKLTSSDVLATINGSELKYGGSITIESGGTSTEVIDNLTSDSSTAALSAKQGNVLNAAIGAKQDIIADIDTIRSNASLGASAVQTESDPVFKASAASGITSTNITNWNSKQDAISDLATIRSGAAKGATSIQSHQTIYALTIQKNGVAVDSYTPNNAAKTINISDVASAATLSSHTSNTSNPHNVTKAQVGLGNVDNTSDANKSVASAAKWTTARTFTIKDASQTNSGSPTSVDGSESETLLLPATIKVTSLVLGGATFTWDSTNGCVVCDKPIVSKGDLTAYGD